jgi:hypothetical protein
MQAISRIAAFAVMGFLLSLTVVAADDKDKKADPAKDDPKKTDVKKDDPAKKDAKNDDPAKKDADKKDDKKPAGMSKLPAPKGKFKGHETDPGAAEKKLLKSAKVPAQVVNVIEDKKTLRLRLTIPYIKINQGQVQNYYNAQMNMIRDLEKRNIQGAENQQLQMARAAAQIYQLATVQKEVEWASSDDVKVRMAHPPPQFDDKGRPKPYTRKELQELRGSDKLPGYPAEFSDIKSGQEVVITLVQKKTGPRPIRRGKGAESEPSPDDLPKMSLIIIAVQPRN